MKAPLYQHLPELQQLVSITQPEEALYFAVFERLFLDIVNNDGLTSEKQRNKRNARKWFYSIDFYATAEIFSPNPKSFTTKVLKVLDYY